MNPKTALYTLALALAGALTLAVPAAYAANPCAAQNPCSTKAKNPCASNPCAAKNPCAASTKVDPKLVTRPVGSTPFVGGSAELLKDGERLWSDAKLSTNGMSCNTCHQGGNSFGASFAKPYPHQVQMAQDRSGMKTIALDEMVQFCIVTPMAGKPLAWNSKDLAALTAYSAQVQKGFKPGKDAAKNPCAGKNPCAAKNPCAPKNPCAAMNPCAMKK